MQHHWPDTDEQPTPMATLTIVEVPLPPDDPADHEQPTAMATLTIEMVLLLPPGEGVEGIIPSYGFRPDPSEFAAASEHLEARGRTTDAAELRGPPLALGQAAAYLVENDWRNPADYADLLLSITIYLADENIHEQVEAAVEELLANADLEIKERDEPVIRSWFRRMRAGIKQAVHSSAAREAALTATHIADSRLIHIQDAQITATLLQNLGGVIASLQPTKDAVLRVGALLIVKVDWVVQVFQLTAAQQAVLDHQPQLASSPREIIAVLHLTSLNGDAIPPAAEG